MRLRIVVPGFRWARLLVALDRWRRLRHLRVHARFGSRFGIALRRRQAGVEAFPIAAIAPAVHEHELTRAMRKPPDSVTAYDLLLQALALLYQLRRPTFDRARGLLQQAMASDPNYAPAYSHAATWHMFRIGQGWSTNVEEDAAEAERCAAAALERDGNDAIALAIHGQMLSFTRRDYNAATLFLDRAISAGPSCHMAWTLSSATSGWIGEGERAVQHAIRALQLSQLDPFTFFT